MRNLAVFVLVVLFFGIWTIGSESESRTTDWTCEMSAYFNGEPAQQMERTPRLAGRGLLTCRNANGFNFDMPVEAKLNVSRNPAASIAEQLRVTIYSEPFVVARDINNVYDKFARQGPPISMATAPSTETLFTGVEKSVVIPLKISIPEEALGEWHVNSIELEFDETAPTLSSF